MGFADDEEDILLEFLDVSTATVSPMVNVAVLSKAAKTSVSGIFAVTLTIAFLFPATALIPTFSKYGEVSFPSKVYVTGVPKLDVSGRASKLVAPSSIFLLPKLGILLTPLLYVTSIVSDIAL